MIEDAVAAARPWECSLQCADHELRLADVIGALSYALDITEGQPEGHAARTCLIGMRIGDEIGLSRDDRSALFYALLLKDLGCSSNAAKMSFLFGADDRLLKYDLKTVDWPRMRDSMRFVKEHVVPRGSTIERLMKIAAMALHGPKGPKRLVETRCQRGAEIARRLGFPEATARTILELDEHYNGKGQPNGRRGEEIFLLARIAGLAQTLEVFARQFGVETALAMTRERRGRWFDPSLVDAVQSVRGDDRFWALLRAPRPIEALAEFEPGEEARLVEEADVDRIAEAFAQVVDAKSPWTFRHSTRVADISVGIAGTLGCDTESMRRLRRVALLHDIGKLGVSNLVLDKPGQLSVDELAALKRHPAYSEEILSRVSVFRELAPLAGAHHERLDGRGYFRGVEAGSLPLAARVLTVADIFEAVTAARPYRTAMSPDEALAMLRRDAGSAVCPVAVAGLEAWLERQALGSRVEAQLKRVDALMGELTASCAR